MTLTPETAGLLLGFFVQGLLVAYSYGKLREAVNSLHHRLDEHLERIVRLEESQTHGSS